MAWNPNGASDTDVRIELPVVPRNLEQRVFQTFPVVDR